MVVPIFDKDKCIGCGICASECIAIFLKEKGKGNVPSVPFSISCIQCGHCIAICQKDAITHPDMDMSNFKPIGKLPDIDDVQLLLESMRSVRHFRDKTIDKDIIQKLINVASNAPSDINSQNRSFYVLTNQNFIEKIESAIVEGFKLYVKNEIESGKNEYSRQIIMSQIIIDEYARGGAPIFRKAPCVIFIYGPLTEKVLFAPFNAIVANTYLMIQAHSMGIGSCIIGRALYNTASFAKYLNIPTDMKIYSAVILGYPIIKYKKTVDRRPSDITWN